KGSQIWGVRGGFFVTSGFQIGANYYYNAHFQPRRANAAASFAGDLGFPQGAVRANVWEAEFTYNFGSRSLLGHGFRPYVVGGAGVLHTNVKDDSSFVFGTINNNNNNNNNNTINNLTNINSDQFVLNTRQFFVPGQTPSNLQNQLQN